MATFNDLMDLNADIEGKSEIVERLLRSFMAETGEGIKAELATALRSVAEAQMRLAEAIASASTRDVYHFHLHR